jgi:hypothetical protein
MGLRARVVPQTARHRERTTSATWCAPASLWLGVGVSSRAPLAQLAGPLLRIRRSGSPRQRTCGQGEARTCELSSTSCNVGIASEALLPRETLVYLVQSPCAPPPIHVRHHTIGDVVLEVGRRDAAFRGGLSTATVAGDSDFKAGDAWALPAADKNEAQSNAIAIRDLLHLPLGG